MVDVGDRVVVARPAARVELSGHGLQLERRDARPVRVRVRQPPLQGALLVVVLGMETTPRKVPPQLEQPPRRGRIAPEVDARIRSKAEWPIRREGHVPPRTRRLWQRGRVGCKLLKHSRQWQ